MCVWEGAWEACGSGGVVCTVVEPAGKGRGKRQPAQNAAYERPRPRARTRAGQAALHPKDHVPRQIRETFSARLL